MADNTHIEWTDASWNPIRATRKDGKPNKGPGGWACQRVSPGCQHCYAATINKRLGTGFDYDAKGIAGSDIAIDEKALTLPLRWKRPRKVFVCSMTDLFGEWVTDEMLDRIFAVMALTPQHTYQVLTKRPERMREYLTQLSLTGNVLTRITQAAQRIAVRGTKREAFHWPLPNVWLGVSVENQEAADSRIPPLLETPAAVRFLSCEPLLGPVVMDECCWLDGDHGGMAGSTGDTLGGIDWIIVGGESGPGARPMDIEWARSLVRQCKAAGVAVFVKQLGAYPRMTLADWKVAARAIDPAATSTNLRLKNRKGGDPEEWPEDLRIREFPRGAA